MPSATRTSHRPDRVGRVAVLADVHGNATALDAVLREVELARPDLLVSCGDLTWGPQPIATIELLERGRGPVLHVRGSADRALVEIADRLALDPAAEVTPRETWMVEAHGSRGRHLLAMFAEHVVVGIEGLGSVLFCHGSPRSDEELLTPATDEGRLREALAGYRASGDPLAEEMVELLVSPPTPAEVVEHAERLVFSG